MIRRLLRLRVAASTLSGSREGEYDVSSSFASPQADPINPSAWQTSAKCVIGRDRAEDFDKFAEAFVEHLAACALRRVRTVDDRARIRAIAARNKADGYRLLTVIHNLVTSELFGRRS